MGAVGDGLVVEEDGLGALLTLEQFVALLPIFHCLLDTFDAGFVLNLKVSDEGKPHDELCPLQVCFELHEVLGVELQTKVREDLTEILTINQFII